MWDIKLVDGLVEAIYPILFVLSWAIVVWQNIRYGRRIKELEKWKEEVRAANERVQHEPGS